MARHLLIGDRKAKLKARSKTPQRFNFDATFKGKPRYQVAYSSTGMYAYDRKTDETRFYSAKGRVDGKVIKSRKGLEWYKGLKND